MCPSVVLRSGKPVLAIGGAGGMKIPNALFDTLREYLIRNKSIEQAVRSARLHSTGTLEVSIEAAWPQMEADYLKELGFKLKTAESTARISAVSFNPRSGECQASMR